MHGISHRCPIHACAFQEQVGNVAGGTKPPPGVLPRHQVDMRSHTDSRLKTRLSRTGPTDGGPAAGRARPGCFVGLLGKRRHTAAPGARSLAFSLVELLIVVVASTVILGGFLGMYSASIEAERKAQQDLETRYLQVFTMDRLMSKVRASSALVRVASTASGPVLVYERVPLVLDAGADRYVEDLASDEAFTGVLYRSGDDIFLRERRPIRTAAARLIASNDLANEVAANQGAASATAVVSFLTGDLGSLADTREELLGTDLSSLVLPENTVRIVVDPALSTRTFSAAVSLTFTNPPRTL